MYFISRMKLLVLTSIVMEFLAKYSKASHEFSRGFQSAEDGCTSTLHISGQISLSSCSYLDSEQGKPLCDGSKALPFKSFFDALQYLENAPKICNSQKVTLIILESLHEMLESDLNSVKQRVGVGADEQLNFLLNAKHIDNLTITGPSNLIIKATGFAIYLPRLATISGVNMTENLDVCWDESSGLLDFTYNQEFSLLGSNLNISKNLSNIPSGKSSFKFTLDQTIILVRENKNLSNSILFSESPVDLYVKNSTITFAISSEGLSNNHNLFVLGEGSHIDLSMSIFGITDTGVEDLKWVSFFSGSGLDCSVINSTFSYKRFSISSLLSSNFFNFNSNGNKLNFSSIITEGLTSLTGALINIDSENEVLLNNAYVYESAQTINPSDYFHVVNCSSNNKIILTNAKISNPNSLYFYLVRALNENTIEIESGEMSFLVIDFKLALLNSKNKMKIRSFIIFNISYIMNAGTPNNIIEIKSENMLKINGFTLISATDIRFLQLYSSNYIETLNSYFNNMSVADNDGLIFLILNSLNTIKLKNLTLFQTVQTSTNWMCNYYTLVCPKGLLYSTTKPNQFLMIEYMKIYESSGLLGLVYIDKCNNLTISIKNLESYTFQLHSEAGLFSISNSVLFNISVFNLTGLFQYTKNFLLKKMDSGHFYISDFTLLPDSRVQSYIEINTIKKSSIQIENFIIFGYMTYNGFFFNSITDLNVTFENGTFLNTTEVKFLWVTNSGPTVYQNVFLLNNLLVKNFDGNWKFMVLGELSDSCFDVRNTIFEDIRNKLYIRMNVSTDFIELYDVPSGFVRFQNVTFNKVHQYLWTSINNSPNVSFIDCIFKNIFLDNNNTKIYYYNVIEPNPGVRIINCTFYDMDLLNQPIFLFDGGKLNLIIENCKFDKIYSNSNVSMLKFTLNFDVIILVQNVEINCNFTQKDYSFIFSLLNVDFNVHFKILNSKLRLLATSVLFISQQTTGFYIIITDDPKYMNKFSASNTTISGSYKFLKIVGSNFMYSLYLNSLTLKNPITVIDIAGYLSTITLSNIQIDIDDSYQSQNLLEISFFVYGCRISLVDILINVLKDSNQIKLTSLLDLKGRGNNYTVTGLQISKALSYLFLVDNLLNIGPDEKLVEVSNIKFSEIFQRSLMRLLYVYDLQSWKTSGMICIIKNSKFSINQNDTSYPFMDILSDVSLYLINITFKFQYYTQGSLLKIDTTNHNLLFTSTRNIFMKNILIYKAKNPNYKNFSQFYENNYNFKSFIIVGNMLSNITFTVVNSIFELENSYFSAIFEIPYVKNFTIIASTFIGNYLYNIQTKPISNMNPFSLFLIKTEGTYTNSTVELLKSTLINLDGYKGSLFYIESDMNRSINLKIENNYFNFIRARQQGGLFFLDPKGQLGSNKEKYIFNITNNTFKNILSPSGILVASSHSFNQLLLKDFFLKNEFVFTNSNKDKSLYSSMVFSVKPYSWIKTNDFMTGASVAIRSVINNKEIDSCYFAIGGFDLFDSPISNSDEIDSILTLDSGNHTTLSKFIETNEIKFYADKTENFICVKKLELNTITIPEGEMTFTIDKYKLMNYFEYLNDNQEAINISITFRTCIAGESLNLITLLCEQCPQGTFSSRNDLLDLNKDCQYCYEHFSFNCYGGNIRTPKKGFWRLNHNSSLFLRCPNREACEGDLDFDNMISVKDSENDFVGAMNNIIHYKSDIDAPNYSGICAKHYYGPLCSQCEFGYGIDSKHFCQECNSAVMIIKRIVIILGRLLLFIRTVRAILKTNQGLEITSGALTDFQVDKMKFSFYIRILSEHFQTILLIISLPFSFPNFVAVMSDIILLPASSDMQQTFSLDCLIQRFNWDIPPSYFTLLLVYLFNLLAFLLIVFKEIKERNSILKKRNKPALGFYSALRHVAINVLIYILLANVLGQAQPFLSQYFCITITDSEGDLTSLRLVSDINVTCNSIVHRYIMVFVSAPTVLLICLLIPLFIMIRLVIAKRNNILYGPELQRKYGFFYYAYRPEVYWYEGINFGRKIIFVLIQQYFSLANIRNNSEIPNASFILILYLFIFYRIFKIASPYKNNYFEAVSNCEQYSQQVLLASSFISALWLVQASDISQAYTLVLLIIAIGLNSIFVLFWLKKIIHKGFLSNKLRILKERTRSIFSPGKKGTRLSILKNLKQDPTNEYGGDMHDYLQDKIKILETQIEKEQKKNERLTHINILLINRVKSLLNEKGERDGLEQHEEREDAKVPLKEGIEESSENIIIEDEIKSQDHLTGMMPIKISKFGSEKKNRELKRDSSLEINVRKDQDYMRTEDDLLERREKFNMLSSHSKLMLKKNFCAGNEKAFPKDEDELLEVFLTSHYVEGEEYHDYLFSFEFILRNISEYRLNGIKLALNKVFDYHMVEPTSDFLPIDLKPREEVNTRLVARLNPFNRKVTDFDRLMLFYNLQVCSQESPNQEKQATGSFNFKTDSKSFSKFSWNSISENDQLISKLNIFIEDINEFLKDKNNVVNTFHKSFDIRDLNKDTITLLDSSKVEFTDQYLKTFSICSASLKAPFINFGGYMFAYLVEKTVVILLKNEKPDGLIGNSKYLEKYIENLLGV